MHTGALLLITLLVPTRILQWPIVLLTTLTPIMVPVMELQMVQLERLHVVSPLELQDKVQMVKGIQQLVEVQLELAVRQ